MSANGTLVIQKSDKELIEMIRELPVKNKALIRGIVIGMNLQKNRAEPEKKN